MKIFSKKHLSKIASISLALTLALTPTVGAKTLTVNLPKTSKVYLTAQDALVGRNPRGSYSRGIYHVYKETKDAINVTKRASSPGGWVAKKVFNVNKTPVKTQVVNVNEKAVAPVIKDGIYTLANKTAGYNTASNAIRGINRVSYYLPGNYYIYKSVPGSLNITKTKGSPGAWIKYNGTKSATAPTITKPVINKTMEQGTIYLSARTRTYTNAADALHKKNAVGYYYPGTYYVYRAVSGSTNITKIKGKPGAWVRNYYLRGSTTTQSTPTDTKPIISTNLGTKVYSWSWGYPKSTGSHILDKHNGIYRQNTNNVHLTFDLGYEYNNYTESLLNTLKKHNVKAVFFVTGDYMRTSPHLVKRMVREGHIVGNHTNKHVDLRKSGSNAVINDIKAWEGEYKRLIGALPAIKLYRPAYGVFTEKTVANAKNLGYKTVLWSFGYKDWDTSAQPTRSYALNKLLSNTNKGEVLLLHSVSKTNKDILNQYITTVKNKGLNFSLLK